MSLRTKLTESFDWISGVNGLELQVFKTFSIVLTEGSENYLSGSDVPIRFDQGSVYVGNEEIFQYREGTLYVSISEDAFSKIDELRRIVKDGIEKTGRGKQLELPLYERQPSKPDALWIDLNSEMHGISVIFDNVREIRQKSVDKPYFNADKPIHVIPQYGLALGPEYNSE